MRHSSSSKSGFFWMWPIFPLYFWPRAKWPLIHFPAKLLSSHSWTVGPSRNVGGAHYPWHLVFSFRSSQSNVWHHALQKCRQNTQRTTHLCTYSWSQRAPHRYSHSSREQVVCLGVSQVVCHPSVMSHMLPHLSQSTSTWSLSPVFRPSSPSLSCPSELDQGTPATSTAEWRIHWICTSHRLWAQVVPIWRFRTSKNWVGQKSWDRSVKYQKEFLEMTIKILSRMTRRRLENLVSICPSSNEEYTQTTIQHCRLGSWRWRITKNAGFTAACTWRRRRKLWFFSQTHNFRQTRRKNNAEERSKCKSYSSWSLQKRELEVKFISWATSVWETECIVFIKERWTGKPVRKFSVQICWSVKIGKISSWRQ